MDVGLKLNYKHIEKKISANEYKNFYEFEKDLRAFQVRLMETEPQGPNKDFLILEFSLRRFQEASHSFIKGLQKASGEQINEIMCIQEGLEKE